MPDNTNPQAREFKANYDANALDNVFANTPDNVADGSDTDGRPRVTGAKIRQLYAISNDVLQWAGQGAPSQEERLRTIAVNDAARF